jgi:hypothetical protein
VWFNITVNNLNRAPYIQAPYDEEPAMAEIDEDPAAQPVNLWDLNDVFGDLDVDDNLRFNIVAQPANVNTQIDGNGILSVSPSRNFHTNGDVEIEIRAVDAANASVNYTFLLEIKPVNDPPDQFALVAPVNNSRVVAATEDSLNLVTFSWRKATQNGGGASNIWEEGDKIAYLFKFILSVTNDTEYSFGPLADTTIASIDPNHLADSLGYEYDREVIMTWWVVGADSSGEMAESTTRNRLILSQLSVDEYGPDIPTVHFLSPSFPNPFNATTSVRFGLPVPGRVDVSVWDMHGRKVATLIEGEYSAGRYETTWSASAVPSGVYLIRMQSGDFTSLRKAILMK